MKVAQKRSGIQRQGIQALYSFVPFKILRAETGKKYTLLIAPLYYLEPKEGAELLKWRSKSLKGRYSHDKKIVVHPYELYPVDFERGGSQRVILVRRNLERTDAWKYPPVYLELSWNSLSAGYYCRFGYVLLSSQQICPLKKNCPYFRATRNGSCYYYSGPLPYSSLYNVFPRISKSFSDPKDKEDFIPVLALRYGNLPLATIRFTERGSFSAFIDGVVFSPKRQDIYAQPLVFLHEGLGFAITNVHAIEIEFVKTVLSEFIKDVLSNKEVAQWVILKYRLYLNDHKGEGVYKKNPSKRGFDAFSKLEDIVRNAITLSTGRKSVAAITKDVAEAKVTDDVVEFATFLFLHTLAHVLKSTLVAKYGCSPEDIEYYIEHPFLGESGWSPDKVKIVLFEAAIGGYGYLRNFVDEIQKSRKSDLLQELLIAAVESFTKNCEQRSIQKLEKLENELKAKASLTASNRLIDNLIRAYRNSFPGTKIYPHVNSIRRAIVDKIPDLSEEERALLDDMLTSGPHCWDGCQLCVMLERGCTFLPFDQPFLVSERLVRASIEKMLDMLKKPVNSSSLRRGIRREFETFLASAELKIDLVSPWISKEIIDMLYRQAERNGLKVRIITKEDLTNRSQQESLEILARMNAQPRGFLQARVLEELHAKGMLVDDLMLLHGSFNFTISGLEEKIENITVDFSLEGVSEFKEKFEKLWREARPIA